MIQNARALSQFKFLTRELRSTRYIFARHVNMQVVKDATAKKDLAADNAVAESEASSHARKVAKALSKLQQPSPPVRQIRRTMSNASTEEDPSYSTPTAQVRKSLAEESADDSPPVRRCDSTDSALKELLTSSEEPENSPQRRAVVASIETYTPSLLATPSSQDTQPGTRLVVPHLPAVRMQM